MKKIITVVFCAVLFAASPGFSAQKSKSLSKEDRESMAKAHEQMAECLRSDKALSECQGMMRGACPGWSGKMGRRQSMMMMENGSEEGKKK